MWAVDERPAASHPATNSALPAPHGKIESAPPG